MKRGRFITLEGGDGSGKTTQARLLGARLAEAGWAVVTTREPGGTPLGERLRDIVLSEGPSPVAELLMFAAARAEHVARVIGPALERPDACVICDRFVDSTRVYQGRLGGNDPAFILSLEAHSTAGVVPDLTVVLDLAPEIARDRSLARGGSSRFDEREVDYHARVRAGFLEIAAAEPARCAVVDASAEPDAVAAAVWAAVSARLKPDAAGGRRS